MGAAERFACIGSIVPARPETWQGKRFITVDVDWAIDPAFEATLDILDEAHVPATIFVTHDTPVLERLRRNPCYELGIHPNFNSLIEGAAAGAGAGGAMQVLRAMKELVPEARCVRSHSLTQSSRLQSMFLELGYTHDCNHFIPFSSGIVLKPYIDWNGITRVPYLWEDDVEMFSPGGPGNSLDIRRAATADGLRVLNFHPIHVALNGPDLSLYERTRAAHRDWAELTRARHPGRGIESLMRELLSL